MRILILSDSHYKELTIKDNYDYVFHCGDFGSTKDFLELHNIIYVKGNCDSNGNKDITKVINNDLFFITHGDKYNIKYDYNNLFYKALSLQATFCLFGHTHKQEFFCVENINFINPGAYKDGYYAIIEDEELLFFNNDKLIKKIMIKW